MPSIFRYGADASVEIEFSEGVLLAECGTPLAAPLDDPAAAVGRALAEPLDYPPLCRSTTPGDRVVVALEEGVPQGGRLAAAVVCSLAEAGVHADGITVLRSADDARRGAGDPSDWLPRSLGQEITLATHDPDHREAIAYLAAFDSGEPILLNRLLTDADLVLPIGCLRPSTMAGYHGIHTPVLPTFSDRRTLLRFRSLDAVEHPRRTAKRLVKESDYVGWLLGVAFTVQVVPGPGDRILHVLAGEVGAVRRRGRKLYEAAWLSSAPRRASLVVAAIEGDANQQTWQNVGRALAAAYALVETGGAIALCCELDGKPGPAVAQLSATAVRGDAMSQIARDPLADALPAAQLVQALDRANVYLISRLDESLVEDLDIAPLAKTEELVRLTRRHESCILLANAPHAIVRTKENDA